MKIHSPSAPILGFNSWDCWGFDFNQERAVANINEFVRRLKPAGYEYFCMDAGWYYHDYYAERLKNPNFDRNKSMDDFGRLIPSEIKFPDGLQFLADLCHGNNIKFGLHVMRGIPRLAVERNCIIKGTRYHARDIANFDDDCAWDCQNIGVDMTKPGAQEYYDSVIEYFADNGVDFLKVDDMAEHPEEMEAVAIALAKVPRPIFYSLSPGDNVFRGNMTRIRKSADMLRITGDIWNRTSDLEKTFERWELWEDYASAECRLDLDMIPFGALHTYIPEDLPPDLIPAALQEKRLARLTLEEKRTFMNQRALAASPLLFGGDLVLSSDEDIALATCPEMLACNQDGITAKRIYGTAHVDVRQKFTDMEQRHGWIGIFNRKGCNYRFPLKISALKLPEKTDPRTLKDIWTGRPLEFLAADTLLFNFKAWESMLLRF